MKIRLELNDSNDALVEASARHIEAGGGLTLAEAFEKIRAMKNSPKDIEEINSVYNALLEGTVQRDESAYKNGVLKKITKAEVKRIYKKIKDKEIADLLQDMATNKPDNYILVTEEGYLDTIIEELNENKELPIDVESTGVDVWKDETVGFVLSDVKRDKHYYIPTRHQTNQRQIAHTLVVDKLKPLIQDPSKLIIGHNLSYDIHMLLNDGIEVRGEVWDTQEGMRLLNENEGTYALKNLVTKYLKIPSKTYGELFGKKGFDEISGLDLATAYAAKDGDITYQLYKFQKEHLTTRFKTIHEYALNVEMPLIKVVVDMERTGFVIDSEYADQYNQELTEELNITKEKLVDELGDINLNSHVQVKESLEQSLGISLENTDAKRTLKPLSKKYPIIDELLKYKELTKLLTTYVTRLPEAIKDKTGRLMPHFNQNGAATGRFSSSGGVNLQNQSRAARSLFVAPEGKVLIGGDFS